MGVLFGANQIGQTVSAEAPGGGSMPSFSFQDTGDDAKVFGQPPWYARGVIGLVGAPIYGAGVVISDGLGGLGYLYNQITSSVGLNGPDADMTPQRLGVFGNQDLGRESFNDLLGGGRWGYILGVQGGFQEDVKSRSGGTNVKVGTPPLGDLALEGVAFAKQCGGEGAGRHGLEGILYHYYYNRASAGSGRMIPKMNIGIGNTSFRDSFLVGLVMRVIDANFNIWGWTLNYKTSSKFRPKKL